MWIFIFTFFSLANSDKEFSRLPRDVIPKYYKLHITPSFETFKFSGFVTISIQVKKSTNEIFLNAHQLEIKR